MLEILKWIGFIIAVLCGICFIIVLIVAIIGMLKEVFEEYFGGGSR